ncbi:MAG: sulfatase [Planctomycetes bacterium]|nr:sulfatase [Planctomycetota bacterium]
MLNYLFFGIALLITATLTAAERPNILWLTSEDNNVNWVGVYGNPNADTPNIDSLAKQGFQYMHCYANAPVCAPSRSTWITGVHAASNGTLPMRSRYDIPHDRIPYYFDHLQKQGYYCINPGKTDYNIGGRNDKSGWEKKASIEQLKQKQPFFAVFNHVESHESRAHGPVEKTSHDPAKVTLAPYHPDLPTIRKNYAKYQDAVSRMDKNIGDKLKQLEAAGLADNTIVIYNSDHGGVLPRSKRFLLDSGTHCPLIIRIPKKFKHLWPATAPGSKVDRLVSFIDMPATWLSLAGISKPAYMQGDIFLGPNQDVERKNHFSYRGRMDERCDSVRAIRNKSYVYLRNYMPFIPRGQYLAYLWKAEAARAWEDHHKAGKTNDVTGRFFQIKPVDELYDTRKDAHNISNLAKNIEFKNMIAKMKQELRSWQLENYDSGLLPEAELAKRAMDNSMTIYELVRDPKLYPLKRYLDVSDIALAMDATNSKELATMLNDSDSGIRYWGMVGLFLLKNDGLEQKNAIKKALSDSSHEVSAMAAWALFNLGEKEVARAHLNSLLKSNSYAGLKVVNIIDWMGEGFDPYKATLKDSTTSVNQSYLDRVKMTAGVFEKKKKKKKK